MDISSDIILLEPRLIEKSNPYRASKQRVRRPQRIVDKDDFLKENFLKEIVGKNTVINSTSLDEDLVSIFPENNLRELISSRKTKIGETTFKISGTSPEFITTKTGKHDYGSMFFCEGYQDVKTLSKATDKFFKITRKYGWTADRFSPISQLTNDLLGSFVDKSTIPILCKGEIEHNSIFRATQCVQSPRFEITSLGEVKGKTHDYDLNSAYGFATKFIPSFHPSEFKHIEDSKYHPEAIEGFLQCEVKLSQSLSYIPLQITKLLENGTTKPIYAKGNLKGYWTKSDIDLITKYEIGKVRVLWGDWFIPIKDHFTYPFAKMVDMLFNIADEPEFRDFSKAITRVIWGKFWSKYESPWFNPLYAAFVTSFVRNQINELALLYSDYLLAVALDGITFDREIKAMKDRVNGSPGGLKEKTYDMFFILHDYYKSFIGNETSCIFEVNGIYTPERKAGIKYVIDNNLEFSDIGKNLGSSLTPYNSIRRICSKEPPLLLPFLENNFIKLDIVNSYDDLNVILNKKELPMIWKEEKVSRLL